jgi:cobalt-zinc-cadmium efflux system outer membrane protein
MVNDRSGLVVVWNRQSADDQKAQLALHEMLGKELTADQAAQIALLNNRHLQATFEDLGIAQADLVQAGLLKNPVFDIGVHFPDSAPRGTYLNLSVAEDFLNIFFIPARRKLAQSRFEQAKAQVTDRVLRLVADTKQAFYGYQGAVQLVELRQTIADAASASVDAANRLHDAGNITDLEFLGQRAQSVRAKIDLTNAEADAAEARERVNALLGLWGEDTVWTAEQRLKGLPASEPESTGLEALAIQQRADLDALRHEVQSNAQMLGFTIDTRFFSEASVGAAAERETDGQWRIGPNISIPVPLFDQGQGAIPRAQAMLRQSQQRYVAVVVDVRSQVRTARTRMLNARSKAQFVHDEVLPLQQQLFDQTQLQFNGMFVSVFQLLAAKREEIDAGRDYIESLRDYWQARAELEKAVGGRLPAVTPPPSTLPTPDTPPARMQPGMDHSKMR